MKREYEHAGCGGFQVAVVLFTCLFLIWFMFAADFARAAAYKGKTKGGSSITFALKGSKVTGIRTVVPTLWGEAEVTTRECPECLSDIPRKASRCSQCPAEVTPVA